MAHAIFAVDHLNASSFQYFYQLVQQFKVGQHQVFVEKVSKASQFNKIKYLRT